ncbi:MAG TPA: M28 family peptidase [Gemmatimonadaceae bacterium]|jgi:Zn-dependent M28 family amino/carboxypeptidase
MSDLLRFALRVPLLITSIAVCAGPMLAQERAPNNDAITAAKLRADLMFLGGDSFRGRLTNTPENNLALEWVASRFEAFGLKGAGTGGSYYQPYNLITTTLGDGNELAIATDGALTRYTVGSDFYPHRHSVSGRVSAPVVFAGYGISATTLGYDDLTGDLKGKILLVLDHEPGENDSTSRFDGLVTSEYANQLKKTLAAQEKGAVGVLFVSDVHAHPGPENFDGASRFNWPAQPPRIERYLLGAWADRVRIPSGQVSVALAEALVRGSGKSLTELSKAADNRRGNAPVPLTGITATLSTNVKRSVVRDRNVVAMLEGSDPTLKSQWIIISGHPDHDGALGDQVWNGADDNGSGTVGLVAIAEAYAMGAKEGRRPKRSILFAAFNSEERGLLGAWAFTEAPLVPLQQIVAVLNMDMIGRNEEVPEAGGARFRGLPPQTAESNNNSVTLLGWTRSPTLTSAVEKANGAYGLMLKKNYDNNVSNLIRRSDHWPFIQRGVPGIWFHTGLHPDYHTIYDDPEKINYPKMEKIARLVHQVSWDLAQGGDRPKLATDDQLYPSALPERRLRH